MRLGNVKTFWVPQPPVNPSLLTSQPIWGSLGATRKRSRHHDTLIEVFTIMTALWNTISSLMLKRFASSSLLETHPTSVMTDEEPDCFKPQMVSHLTDPVGKSEYRH